MLLIHRKVDIFNEREQKSINSASSTVKEKLVSFAILSAEAAAAASSPSDPVRSYSHSTVLSIDVHITTDSTQVRGALNSSRPCTRSSARAYFFQTSFSTAAVAAAAAAQTSVAPKGTAARCSKRSKSRDRNLRDTAASDSYFRVYTGF